MSTLSDNKNENIKPFVKWAGGKRQLMPEITKYLPKNMKNYYEPFVGGGAVFLNLQRDNVTINDFNSELTNAYLVIKNNVEELISNLKVHDANNSKDYFYELRMWDRNGILDKKDNAERAARFIYLNKTGFNGLFRVNSKGQMNVPYGKYKNPAIVNEDVLRAVSKYLNDAHVQVNNGDYYDTIKNATSGDFVYLDPPYAPMTDSKQSFVGYTLNGFGYEEQKRLRDAFDELTKNGVKAMLSNSNVPMIQELYKDYASTTKVVKASRNINSNGKGRGKVDEVLVMNYDYTK